MNDMEKAYLDYEDCDTDRKSFNAGYSYRESELEAVKKERDELQEFINRFCVEYYLKNSSQGLSELFNDIVTKDFAKLENKERV